MEVDIAASTVEKLRTETAGRKERHSSNFRTDPSVDAAATFTAARFNVKTQHSITKRATHHAAAATALPPQRGSILCRSVHVACKWVHTVAATTSRYFCGSMYVCTCNVLASRGCER